MELTVLAFVLVLLVVGLVATWRWAGRKGWVYNKHNPRPRRKAIPFAPFDELYRPSVEHFVEEQASEHAQRDQDESGDTSLP